MADIIYVDSFGPGGREMIPLEENEEIKEPVAVEEAPAPKKRRKKVT